jgi:hypothetical protein
LGRRGWVAISLAAGAAAAAAVVAYGVLRGPAPTATATLTATATATAALTAAPTPDAAPRVYDVNHVLGTGQSLSVGTVGMPPLTTEQPFANLMFAGGVMPERDLGAFVPLVEGDLIPGSMMRVETMSSGFANLVAALARASGESHDVLVSQHGIGGEPYAALKKGGTRGAFEAGIAQAAAARGVAVSLGKSYVVRAVTNVHGETDHEIGSARYTGDLLAWQADYDADLRAVTHQTEPIPMFETQISSWTRYGAATSGIPAQQLAAHVEAPGKVILVGAKYHLPYVSDGIHLTNEGYRHMGEDYAKAYRRVVLEHGTWEPVRPRGVSRDGATITVTFHVPAPPLVFDTKRVVDPAHLGFEYADDAGGAAPSIVAVALAAEDAVTITLSAPPSAGGGRIRYAWTGRRGAAAGPVTGPRGNLRDSDATPSRAGYPLYNWCIHFDEAVP